MRSNVESWSPTCENTRVDLYVDSVCYRTSWTNRENVEHEKSFMYVRERERTRSDQNVYYLYQCQMVV
jgi:hypothetical protein